MRPVLVLLRSDVFRSVDKKHRDNHLCRRSSSIEGTKVDAVLKGGISLHKNLKILNIPTEKKMRNFVKKDTFMTDA